MDATILGLLIADGITSGVIYGLLAITIVLVFTVTRVLFVPMGELLMYAPLTYALLVDHKLPGSIWLGTVLLTAWGVLDLFRGARRLPLLLFGGAGALLGMGMWSASTGSPILAWVLAVGVVVLMGIATYRVFFEPIPHASVLTYLILSLGLHFVLQGLGLVFFGPEQYRLPPLLPGEVQLGPVPLPKQNFAVYALALAWVLALYGFFSRSLYGKALLACAINRRGARLTGISIQEAGRVAFILASLISALGGMLLAPLTNAAYFMGFIPSLKGFVAAVLGGLVSYPLAAVGALLVGTLEAFSAFYASAYKEALVFALLLPILFVQSLRTLEIGGVEE
ncbi:MAG: branched-chain amino acid ABC transporter permease [Armatimonadetes bacterium]|nr:branched-chain amino acid ABC transporter permease [Armatimonadota bacterium]MDW8153514.1 branched-chain amino acid ABC transporter permease [Armatimonadota bacterium]